MNVVQLLKLTLAQKQGLISGRREPTTLSIQDWALEESLNRQMWKPVAKDSNIDRNDLIRWIQAPACILVKIENNLPTQHDQCVCLHRISRLSCSQQCNSEVNVCVCVILSPVHTEESLNQVSRTLKNLARSRVHVRSRWPMPQASVSYSKCSEWPGCTGT